MATLPKGITQMQYTTKSGKQIKYRVRYQYRDFKLNRVFDNLDEALSTLADCKSKLGRFSMQEATEAQKVMLDFLTNPPFSRYIDLHFNYRYSSLDMSNPLQNKRYRSLKSIYEMLKNAEVEKATIFEINSFDGNKNNTYGFNTSRIQFRSATPNGCLV